MDLTACESMDRCVPMESSLDSFDESSEESLWSDSTFT